jgi:alpha-L-fucosidase
MFLHFGVNTFTDREWGDGREDPTIFNPAALDAGQWARAAHAAGFRAMILTAKHHDGFCLWPSAVTAHSVAQSPWRGGRGDVVREFVDACRAEGLHPGLYLSPWDRNAPVYGDSPRYNDFYVDQLTELLTRYGALAEVWFDGANGEGPNGRRQRYDWPRIFATVRRLQPDAVMFSDAGPDVRWIGNEDGVAGDPNWSTVDPETVPYPGASGDGVTAMLQHGDPRGTAWRPGETDTSIRPGWFYHPSEDTRVKTVDQLTAAYFASVGRNSKLLLNVPPNRDGVLSPIDCSRIAALHQRISTLFGPDVAAGTRVAWHTTGARAAVGELDLGRSARVGIARLEEAVAEGQVVARYTLLGSDGREWRALSRGETIGYRKLDRFEPRLIRHVRLVIDDAVAEPRQITIGLYDDPAP